MGGCVSKPPGCRNGCGRDSGENCFGYCPICFEQVAKVEHRGSVQIERKSTINNANQRTATVTTTVGVPPYEVNANAKPVHPHTTLANNYPGNVSRPIQPAAQPPAPAPTPVAPPAPIIQTTASLAAFSSLEPGAPPPAYSPPPSTIIPGGPQIKSPPQQPNTQYLQATAPSPDYPPYYPNNSQPTPSISYKPSYDPNVPVPQILSPVVKPTPAPSPMSSYAQPAASFLPQANVACPSCRAPLYIPPIQTTAVCPSCRVTFAMPSQVQAGAQPALYQQPFQIIQRPGPVYI